MVVQKAVHRHLHQRQMSRIEMELHLRHHPMTCTYLKLRGGSKMAQKDYRAREIITSAVCGKGSKYSQNTYTIRPANRPTTI
ncbi:MAG: outer spore coat protein CotE, partial [Tumebacillaceae bacterium]